MLFFDGGKKANAPGAETAEGAIGAVLKDPRGNPLPDSEISRRIGPVPDPHTAEYQALLAGIELARRKGIEYLAAFSDSRTLVNQVNNLWKKKSHLEELCLRAQQALSAFGGWQISWIPREWNRQADELAGRALAAES